MAPAGVAASDEPIVCWRVKLSGLSVAPPPSGKLGHEGGAKAWSLFYVKFTAIWSHETVASSSFSPNDRADSIASECYTLILPNPSGCPSGPLECPDCELKVQLCAKVSGHSDEVVGLDTCSLRKRKGEVVDLLLRGPVWRGLTASVRFTYEMEGLQQKALEEEWRDVPLPGSQMQVISSFTLSKARRQPSCGNGALGRSPPSRKKGANQISHFEPGFAQKRTALVSSPSRQGTCAALAQSKQGTSASLYQAQKPVRPGAGLRFRKTPAPAAMPDVAESTNRMLARPTSAPSARLLLQLEECSRIKQAFAKAGLQCPMPAIERGLLLPDDRPLLGMSLPRPGSRMVDPFSKPPPKKKTSKLRRPKSAAPDGMWPSRS